ncbi:MAG TPA: Uma2 family endonuclease [Thermoguttaceae bacterium]|nr:Uma2 family endonuclease [Thermoguttaceae bacterium]
MADARRVADDLLTVEDFYAFVSDGQKADLIDGVIYMASPDSRRANDLTGFLHWLLRGFLERRGIGGKVVFSRFAFRLSEFSAPEPDVAYVRPERVGLIGEGGMRGGPDVAVEVVSRESRHRDYDLKRQLYEEAGVSEYWIIDPIQKRVEFLLLEEGRYQLAPLDENRLFRSRALPGFWIDVDWLLADPLPPATRCLEDVLRTEQ